MSVSPPRMNLEYRPTARGARPRPLFTIGIYSVFRAVLYLLYPSVDTYLLYAYFTFTLLDTGGAGARWPLLYLLERAPVSPPRGRKVSTFRDLETCVRVFRVPVLRPLTTDGQPCGEQLTQQLLAGPLGTHTPRPIPATHISRSGRPPPSLEQRPGRCWQEGAPARDRAHAAGYPRRT